MKLGLIGAGNMASALARGIGEPVLVHDIDAGKAEALAAELGGEALDGGAEVAERADVVVLCHKPQQLAQVAEQLGGRAGVVASILAATTTTQIEQAYPSAPVYRFLPNIPTEVRKGMLCYVPGRLAGEGPEKELLELFGRAGTILRLDEEALMEPAMALMSCGPAFMALVAESFAEAGGEHGLAPDDAMRMVAETMGGSAAYLAANDWDAEALRVRVATPGGATERGLVRLEEEGLRRVCRAAVDAVVEGTGR
jgi:pyrroline-5-carboxylate reductase